MEIVIYVLFIFFIVWISCIPSGKSCFRKNINEYKKWISENNKLEALGKSLMQDNNFKILMLEFKKLSTFEEVDLWDKEADLELWKIQYKIQQLDSNISQCQIAFCQSKLQQLLFKLTLQQINHKYKIPLESMAHKLQEAIDFTPNSLNEKNIN